MENKHQVISQSKVRPTPEEDLKHRLENEDKPTSQILLDLFNGNKFKKISEDNIYLDVIFDNPNEEEKRAIQFITSNARIHYGKFLQFDLVRMNEMISFTITDIKTKQILHKKTFNDTPGKRFPDQFKLGRFYFLYDGYKIMTALTNRTGFNNWIFEKLN